MMTLTFPGGTLKTITIAATAGNVVTNKTPGTGKRWVILYGRIVFVADGTAANRILTMRLTDGTNVLTQLPAMTTTTAGQTKSMSLNGARIDQGLQALDNDHLTINKNHVLEGADQIRIAVIDGQAGDSYSGFIRVLEFGS